LIVLQKVRNMYESR